MWCLLWHGGCSVKSEGKWVKEEVIMKRASIVFLALCSLFMLAGQAWSIPMSTVGQVDTLIRSTNLGNSGDATEIGWVQSVLKDPTLQIMAKYEDASMVWQQVDYQPTIYAINFADSNVAYFLIKLGNIAPGSKDTTIPDTFLFQNQASLEWGVINLATIAPGYEFDIYKVSHVTAVPEPGTMLLLGVGLLGLGIASRRKS